MTIRFLKTTDSSSPDYPFQAGQVITVPRLTTELRTWIEKGHAELVEEEPEAAVMGPPEQQAVTVKAKARGRR